MRGFVWAVALLLAFGLACGDGGGSNGALLPRDGTVIRGDRRPLSDAASELASLDRTGSVADATVDAAQIPIDGAAPEADAESECRLNSDCPPGQYCGEHRCQFDCREDRDCVVGERCVSGRCNSAHCRDLGCAAGQRCVDETGLCAAAAVDCRDTGCPAGASCNPLTLQCEVGPAPSEGRLGDACAVDADCLSAFCDGVAIAGEPHRFCSILCCSEGECPIGFGCLSGGGPRSCVPSAIFPPGYTFDAAAGQSCGRGGGACQSGLCDVGRDRCERTCCTDDECGGLVCLWQGAGDGQRQMCGIPLGFGRTGEACGSEFDCQNQVCVVGPGGRGLCGDMCCSNAQCPAGYACQQVAGAGRVYISACAPSTFGAGGLGDGCEGGGACQSGLCVEGGCATPCCEDESCPAGHRCDLADNGEGGNIRVCRPRP